MKNVSKLLCLSCCAIVIIAVFILGISADFSDTGSGEWEDWVCQAHTNEYNPSSDFSYSASEDGAVVSGDNSGYDMIFDYSGISGRYGSFSSLGTGAGTAAGEAASGGYAKFEITENDINYGGGNACFAIKYCGHGSADYIGGKFSPVSAAKPLVSKESKQLVKYIVSEFDISTDTGFTPTSVFFNASYHAPQYDSVEGTLLSPGSELTEVGSKNPIFEIDKNGIFICEGNEIILSGSGDFITISIIIEITVKDVSGGYCVNPDAEGLGYSPIWKSAYDLSQTKAHIYINGEFAATSASVFSSNIVDKEFSSSLGIDTLEFRTDASSFEELKGTSLCIDNLYTAYHTESNSEAIDAIVSTPEQSITGRGDVHNMKCFSSGITSISQETPDDSDKETDAPTFPSLPQIQDETMLPYIENIKINISSYGYFVLNFYIPNNAETSDGYSITTLGLYTSENGSKDSLLDSRGEVLIDGKSYTHYCIKLGAADTEIRSFYLFSQNERDNVAVKNELRYGLPYYAFAIMKDETQSTEAKSLVINMVNYASTLITYLGINNDSYTDNDIDTSIYSYLLSNYSSFLVSIDDDEFRQGGSIYEEEVKTLSYKENAGNYISAFSFYFGTYEPSFVLKYSSSAKTAGISVPKNSDGVLFDTPAGVFVKISYGDENATYANHLSYTKEGAKIDFNSPLWTSSENMILAFARSNSHGEHPLYKISDTISVYVSDGTSFTYSLAAYISTMIDEEPDAAQLGKSLYIYSKTIKDFMEDQ